MISFFRKIRQRLITDNRVSKYLFYAIGEIILVVIGILIALQVNEWSDRRKNKEIEYNVLQGLLAEFKNAELELRADDSTRIQIRSAISTSLEIRSNEAPYLLDFDSTSSLLYYMKEYRFYTPSHPQLKDLQSSGKFDMISSKATKENLLKYIEMWDRITILEKNTQNALINNLHPYLSTHCDLSLISAKNPNEEQELINQFQTMIKDRTFGSLMRLRLEEVYTIMYYSETLMKDIKDCQESIAEVLKNLES